MWAWRVILYLGGEFLALFDGLLDGPDHVERRFWQMIVLARDQSFEALDGIGEFNEDAGQACEHLGHMHWLRKEPLDLAGTRDGELVLLRQLVHAENGDKVLKRLGSLT